MTWWWLNEVKHFSSKYAIYFDGWKDKALIQIKDGERTARKKITEEHIALLSEPGQNMLAMSLLYLAILIELKQTY
jgi:hypothetical protein